MKLNAILDAYQRGERSLPSYAELRELAISDPLRTPAMYPAPPKVEVDLSEWNKARYGVFLPDGSFEELKEPDLCGQFHPYGNTARWVGGISDMQLLRAVFKGISKDQHTLKLVGYMMTDSDHLATCAEFLLDSVNKLAEANVALDEAGDEQKSIAKLAFESIEQEVTEYMRAVHSIIYEYRKRAGRVRAAMKGAKE